MLLSMSTAVPTATIVLSLPEVTDNDNDDDGEIMMAMMMMVR